MASSSRRPQYWLMSTVEPLCTPKMRSRTTKMGVLALVTPASGPSPSIPTMKVSTSAREVVTRFCKMIGRARRNILR